LLIVYGRLLMADRQRKISNQQNQQFSEGAVIISVRHGAEQSRPMF
jgi:hypothetical protein